jgi:hypothetical protein
VNVVAPELFAELPVENLGDRRAHEIDDFLGRIDDAHRVGELDRVALEESLIDRVEEVLFVGPAATRAGGVLDGDVEAVEVKVAQRGPSLGRIARNPRSVIQVNCQSKTLTAPSCQGPGRTTLRNCLPVAADEVHFVLEGAALGGLVLPPTFFSCSAMSR